MDPFRQEMTFEEYLNFPKTLGWKHEYFGGALHRSPALTAVATFRANLHVLLACKTDDPASESSLGELELRPPVKEDHPLLISLFCECFEDAIEYAGYRPTDIIRYAHKSLNRFFGESPTTFQNACHVALINGNIVGASLIATCDQGAILQPIFVAQKFRRYGLATRLLVASAVNLAELDCDTLTSRCNLGNEASMRWHAKCGFVEILEEFPASHRAHIYSLEAERHERLNLPTAQETRALADYWRNECDRLQERNN